MNIRWFLVAVVLALPAAGLHAEDQLEPAKALYHMAIEALDKHDCTTAIALLEKYKVRVADKLREHPSFAKSIDRQIDDCRNEMRKGRESLRVIADTEPWEPGAPAAGSEAAATMASTPAPKTWEPGAPAGGVAAGSAAPSAILILIVILLLHIL